MARKVEKQPKLKLWYFDIRGKGEPIRLFCRYAGLEFEDFRFTTRDQFYAQKEAGNLPFGQVPLLEVDGEHKLVQTAAILRYLSKIAGLYPEDAILAAKVDALVDQETDAFTGVTAMTYNDRFGIPMTEEAKLKCRGVLSTEVLPRHLAAIESTLKASPSGFMAGTDEPSAADFIWFCRLHQFLPYFDESCSPPVNSLEKFPACQAFVKLMGNLDSVKGFYADEASSKN